MAEERSDNFPTVQAPAIGCLMSLVKLAVATSAGMLSARILFFGTSWISVEVAQALSIVFGIGVFAIAVIYIDRLAPSTWANQPSILVSHWYTMIEGLSERPTAFYESVTASIESREIPDLSIRYVFAKEGGLASAKRLYLEVRREKLVYYVCGAPFANGFFVSSWLGEVRSIVLLVLSFFPFAAVAFPWLFRGNTYYETDTTLMFQSLVHSAVLEAVDGLTETKGIRGPVDLERKPTLRDFFAT